MKIASISEDKTLEKRVAITPEIAKKYISSGFDVTLSKDYGEHLGFKNQHYESLGVKLLNDDKEIISKSNVILQLRLPSDDKLFLLKENQTLIGVLDSYQNKDKILDLTKKKN